MKKNYRIEMEVSIDVADDASDRDIEQFIAFELGAAPSMRADIAVLNKEGDGLDVTDFDICEI